MLAVIAYGADRRGLGRAADAGLLVAVAELAIVGAMWVGFWLVSNIAAIAAQHGIHVQPRSARGLLSSAPELDGTRNVVRWSLTANLSRMGAALLGTDDRPAKTGGSAATRHERDAPVVAGPTLSLAMVGRGALAWLLLSACICTTGSGPWTPQMNPIVSFHEVSKWYGNVIGLNKLSIQVPAGVTGLLGPNGCGKIDAAATGDRPAPSQPGRGARAGPSRLEQSGAEPLDRALSRAGCVLRMDDRPGVHLYVCPPGRHGRAAAREATARTLAAVEMTKNTDRAIRGYSKGMRQRTKLAQAMVHDPKVLFLDEPLTGTDPVARRDLMDIISAWRSEGRSVLVSSHVLHEVQSLTPTIVLLNRGRLVAEGQIRQIRDLIDNHPHHRIVCIEYRRLAARLLLEEDVGVESQRGGAAVDGRDALAGRIL